MVAGLEKIDKGKIILENNLLNDLLPSKRQIAVVFQSYAPIPAYERFSKYFLWINSEKIEKDKITQKVLKLQKF